MRPTIKPGPTHREIAPCHRPRAHERCSTLCPAADAGPAGAEWPEIKGSPTQVRSCFQSSVLPVPFPSPGKVHPSGGHRRVVSLVTAQTRRECVDIPTYCVAKLVMLFRSHHRPSNKLGNPTIRATVVPGHDSSTTGGGGGGGCSNGAPSSTTGKLDQVFFREAWGETGGRLAGLEAIRELQSRAFLTQDREGKVAERLLQEQSWLERAPSNHCCSRHS